MRLLCIFSMIDGATKGHNDNDDDAMGSNRDPNPLCSSATNNVGLMAVASVTPTGEESRPLQSECRRRRRRVGAPLEVQGF